MDYGYMTLRPDTPFEPFCAGKTFVDQQGDTAMPAFDQLCSMVQPEDEVTVPSLTSLGYSFHQICSHWELLRQKGARIRLMDFPDKVAAGGQFDEILDYFCRSEESLRAFDGLEAAQQARAYGGKSGRKRKNVPDGFAKLCQAYREGMISSREAAAQLEISHTTFIRWCRQAA